MLDRSHKVLTTKWRKPALERTVNNDGQKLQNFVNLIQKMSIW